jgi:beta-glucosidase/6-phospho-beta-glucosidase/beta-galactosidase
MKNKFSPELFYWATGIEDTFVTHASPVTGRSLDEYELTGHYERWEEDIRLISELGVKTARYGLPWHRIQTSPDTWNWDWADAVLDRMLDLGINPIIDLVHYGLPPWMDAAFMNPDYPSRVAEFASRVASRFKDRITWYTPFNEPRIAAWYCGRIGWWPPFLRTWKGFLQILLQICRGIALTQEALRSINPHSVMMHVDATDLYLTRHSALQSEVQLRQEIVFLALDLLQGRVRNNHPLWGWILKHGLSEEELGWFWEKRTDPDVIGINLYPMFTQKEFVQTNSGRKTRLVYATGELVETLSSMYWNRYGLPLMISETASLGSVSRRRKWLQDSVKAVHRVRERGIPMIGYTWWPLFSLVAWAYRQGNRPFSQYLLHMGLWDLDESLKRVRTPVVDEYKKLVESKSEMPGVLANV